MIAMFHDSALPFGRWGACVVRGWLEVNFCLFFLWQNLTHPAKSRCRRSVCQEYALEYTQYSFCYYLTIRFAGIFV